MRVFGYATDPEDEWTAPFPTKRCGVKLRLLGGNLVSPDLSTGHARKGREGESARNWFNWIPGWVRLTVAPRPIYPFLSFRVWRFGFYIGHKVFGIDSMAYLDYPGIKSADVFTGSRALTGFTARFSMSLA